MLGVSVAATNSLTQRARATVARRLPPDRADWARPTLTPDDRVVLERYVRAHEQGDAAAILGLLRDDVRITMPPEPPAIGLAAATAFLRSVIDPAVRPGDWRMVPTRANGRPAAANYLRRPGDDRFRALSVDVLTLDGQGRIAEINCFLDDALFAAFGLPLVEPPSPARERPPTSPVDLVARATRSAKKTGGGVGGTARGPSV